MTPAELLARLQHDAFLAIRAAAWQPTGDPAAALKQCAALADLFHNVPLVLESDNADDVLGHLAWYARAAATQTWLRERMSAHGFDFDLWSARGPSPGTREEWSQLPADAQRGHAATDEDVDGRDADGGVRR